MAKIGILGMTLPAEYGGIGASCLDCALTIEQIASSGTGAWWLPAFCSSIPECIFKFGTEDQRSKYLKPVTGGSIYPSIQFTEADTGSDPEALITKAKPVGNRYVINGMKRFSTFGARDGYAILYAKDETGKCTAFITEKKIKGYSAARIYELMGSGGVESADVYFEDMELSQENILGKKGHGMEILQYWISIEKIQQCAACVGIANAAYEEAILFAKTCKVRGRTQSSLQGIRWMLAEMHAKLEAIRTVTYRAAFLKDKSSSDWVIEAASAKLFVIPTAMEVVNMSRRIHGGYGYTKEFKIERLYRAIAGASAIAVSLEINKSMVGAALLQQ